MLKKQICTNIKIPKSVTLPSETNCIARINSVQSKRKKRNRLYSCWAFSQLLSLVLASFLDQGLQVVAPAKCAHIVGHSLRQIFLEIERKISEIWDKYILEFETNKFQNCRQIYFKIVDKYILEFEKNMFGIWDKYI